VVVPLLVSGARAGEPPNAAGPGLDLAYVGAAGEVDDLISLVPEADRQEVRSAAARVIARAAPRGGDWEISYSKNGRFRLVKTVIPRSTKDEVGFVNGVLLDEDGREVAHWPRMYKDVFISNTGRNLVAAEKTWGTGFDFYDVGHTEPVSSFRRHIADGQFSDDGRFFVALSVGVSLFSADGQLLWSRSIKGGRGVFISPDGEPVVLADGRPAGAGKLPPEAMSDNAAPITVFSASGEVLLVYDTRLRRVDGVTFADDGRRFAVVGTNELLLFESDSGTLLKRIAVGPPWDDIGEVAFSPDGRYVVAAITRYPTTDDPARPAEHRYELWDLRDLTSGAAREDEAPALRIARVIEVTDGSKTYTQPVWSPDGKKLAFSAIPGFSGIYIRNADGSGPITEVASATYSGFNLVWTSDSEGIVIRVRTGAGRRSIAYIDIETGEVRVQERALHPNPPVMNVYGDVAIDVVGGTKILDDSTGRFEDEDEYYSDERPASADLRLERDRGDSRKWVIIEGDGTTIMEFPHRSLFANMSPARDRVAFLGEGQNLYVSRLDGSEKVNLGSGGDVDWDWSPGGEFIVYVGAVEDDGHYTTASELFAANPETGSVTQLTDTPDVIEMFPHWSPDGTRIAYSTHRTGKICVAILEEVK
jgi:Tol biopolymer transport system component